MNPFVRSEMKKKLLVLGASGLTGYKTVKIAAAKYEVYGTFNARSVNMDNCNMYKLDITNPEQLKKTFTEINPDIVINTTALHNVDYCEEFPDKASSANTNAVRYLLENSEKLGSKLIHISTDYVFDGKKNSPYDE